MNENQEIVEKNTEKEEEEKKEEENYQNLTKILDNS